MCGQNPDEDRFSSPAPCRSHTRVPEGRPAPSRAPPVASALCHHAASSVLRASSGTQGQARPLPYSSPRMAPPVRGQQRLPRSPPCPAALRGLSCHHSEVLSHILPLQRFSADHHPSVTSQNLCPLAEQPHHFLTRATPTALSAPHGGPTSRVGRPHLPSGACAVCPTSRSLLP